MGYWTWVAISFLLGVLALISPIFIGPLLPVSRRRGLANRYYRMAGAAGQRIILVRRKLGGYSLLPSSYDSEKEAEEVTLDGESKHFDDSERFMSRFNSKPFGLAYEKSSAIVTPLVAEIGREFSEWLENDEHKVALETDNGTITAFNRTLTLPEASAIVDPAQIMSVLPGSARPSVAETGYEYARKSQEGFNSRRMVEGMVIVIAFAASFGMVFLAMREGGGGSVTGVNIGMAVNALGVLV